MVQRFNSSDLAHLDGTKASVVTTEAINTIALFMVLHAGVHHSITTSHHDT